MVSTLSAREDWKKLCNFFGRVSFKRLCNKTTRQNVSGSGKDGFIQNVCNKSSQSETDFQHECSTNELLWSIFFFVVVVVLFFLFSCAYLPFCVRMQEDEFLYPFIIEDENPQFCDELYLLFHPVVFKCKKKKRTKCIKRQKDFSTRRACLWLLLFCCGRLAFRWKNVFSTFTLSQRCML